MERIIKEPCCPNCGSRAMRANQADGATTIYFWHCQTCGEKTPEVFTLRQLFDSVDWKERED